MDKYPIIRNEDDTFNPQASLNAVLATESTDKSISDLLKVISDSDFLDFHETLLNANQTRNKRLLALSSQQLGIFSNIINCLRHSASMRLKIPENLSRFEDRLNKFDEIIANCSQRYRDIINESLAQAPMNGRI